MSSADMAFAFTSALRDMPDAHLSVLRLALRRGEVLRLPRLQNVRVLSGRAWVSYAGIDYVVEPSCRLGLGRSKESAVVSALGEGGLLFEVW